MIKLKFAVVLAGATFAWNVWAQPIENFVVEGNKRVEDATVLSYLSVRAGQEYNPALVNESIKNLYATGLFANVQVAAEGNTLTIQVTENPLVNKVVFENNEEIVDDRLQTVVSLQPRAVYTPGKVQNDVREIKAAYRQSGYFLTEVTPQIIQREQNRVDVVYKIEEGQSTKVAEIRFVGNKRFDDEDLKSVIRTKESRWWRILSSTDVYDPALVDVDKELLRRYYLNHGYADFQVVSAVAELSRDKERFYITFSVSEGPVYSFGNVDVKINTDEEGLTAEQLKDVVSIKSGERYNGSRIDTNIDYLTDALGDRGYAFLDVLPDVQKDEANRLVNVVFNIAPGPKVYVNRINILGNDRTQDNVIRRQMRFAEGDAFSSNKLKRSRDRLNYLGYFQNVDVRPVETEYPDRVDLDVQVAEQSTGEFNIGAGFSTYEGFLANANIRERNFMGRGQDVTVSFALSSKRQDFRLSFEEPWFMNQDLTAGVDLFNERRDYQDESSYDLSRGGVGLRLGFPINEFTRNTVRVGFSSTEINNVDSGASKFVKAEEGKRDSITLGNTYTIDTRDSYLTPTHGYRVSLSADYSGFGTDTDYLRGVLSGSWHKEVSEGWVFSLGGRAGMITDLGGEPLPLYEYFRMGGSTLRGFASGGVGPRDRTNDDSLGGKYMVGNNVELTFPIPSLSEMGVHGLMFLDGGMVTDFKDDPDVVDSKSYRLSAGTGLYWQSPVGPLRFEFGIPVVKEEEDESEIFSFSIGTRF